MTTEETVLLRDLFGDYRAEWRRDLFPELFVEPPYFPKLTSARPSFLIGGRGTGKTTALRSLRFEVLGARVTVRDLPYVGLYIRINKNRVRAFQGASRPPSEWARIFAHYFNLLFAQESALYLRWRESQSMLAPLSVDFRRASLALALPPASDVLEFLNSIQAGLMRLELFVNDSAGGAPPALSMAESPAVLLAESIANGGSAPVFCCIDEYENLLDYQQAVLNTYIKHSEPPLSYKVGTRLGGLRNRQTIDANDLLVTPDDFAEIDITEEGFRDFAASVASRRIEYVNRRSEGALPGSLDELLPGLTRSEEARLLGAERWRDTILAELRGAASEETVQWAAKQLPEDLAVLRFCAESGERTLTELAVAAASDHRAWRARINNYGYASLFWLAKGHKGVRIRKYYSGRSTFLGLAGGNIRYFLELIDQSLALALASSAVSRPLVISAVDQTLAARSVGRRRLDSLEGESEHGFALKRLVLAVGKVFYHLARNPIGRTPEVTSFVIAGDAAQREEIGVLLGEGIAQLAFLAKPRTKPTSPMEMRDSEYRLHPIFAPFFEYSHRQKRRMVFDAGTLLALARPRGDESPNQLIAKLVGGAPEGVEDLPEQLRLFSGFFGGVR